MAAGAEVILDLAVRYGPVLPGPSNGQEDHVVHYRITKEAKNSRVVRGCGDNLESLREQGA